MSMNIVYDVYVTMAYIVSSRPPGLHDETLSQKQQKEYKVHYRLALVQGPVDILITHNLYQD